MANEAQAPIEDLFGVLQKEGFCCLKKNKHPFASKKPINHTRKSFEGG